jgi:hypothetical protein
VFPRFGVVLQFWHLDFFPASSSSVPPACFGGAFSGGDFGEASRPRLGLHCNLFCSQGLFYKKGL